MFQLDSMVVSIQPLHFLVLNISLKGLTLGRVILVEVTKRVKHLHLYPRNLIAGAQVGTIYAIYIYTLLAIL